MSEYQNYGYPSQGDPQVMMDVQALFTRVDVDRSGRITATELQTALAAGQGRQFSDAACKLLIGLFNTDGTHTVDLSQFQSLYRYVNEWLTVFRTYDKDQSGFIDKNEFSQALQTMGFRFSDEFVRFVVEKNSRENPDRMSVDQFIVVCVQIHRCTESFRSRDVEQVGTICIKFEDFVRVVLELFI